MIDRYGMSINNDSVMRSVYYKYMHPKEVFIAEGTLIPDLIRKKVRSAPFTGMRCERGRLLTFCTYL
jgi:intraflagellar transport protein 52